MAIHSKSRGEHTCSSSQSSHQNVYNMPIFGLYECFSVSDRCLDVSSFVFIVFILIHGDRTFPSVILGDSRDLTGGVPSWWSRCRLCRSCDLVHTFLSFAFAFVFTFLALVVGCAALRCVLEPAMFGQHVRIRSNSSLIHQFGSFPCFCLCLSSSIHRSPCHLVLFCCWVSLSHLPDTVRCLAGTEESPLSSPRR